MAPPAARSRKSRSASASAKSNSASANKNQQPSSARVEKPAAAAPAKPKPAQVPASPAPAELPEPTSDVTAKDTNNNTNEEEPTAPAPNAPEKEKIATAAGAPLLALADKQPELDQLKAGAVIQDAIPAVVSTENAGSNPANGDLHPDSPRAPSSPGPKPNSGTGALESESESDGRKEMESGSVDVVGAPTPTQDEKKPRSGSGPDQEDPAAGEEGRGEHGQEQEQVGHQADDAGRSLGAPPANGEPAPGPGPDAPAPDPEQVEQEGVKLEKLEAQMNANTNNDGRTRISGKSVTAAKANPAAVAVAKQEPQPCKEEVKKQSGSSGSSGPAKTSTGTSNSNPGTGTGTGVGSRFKLSSWPPSPIKRTEKASDKDKEKESKEKEVKTKANPTAALSASVTATARGPPSPVSAKQNASVPGVTGVVAKTLTSATTAKPYIVKKVAEAATVAASKIKGNAPVQLPILALAPRSSSRPPTPLPPNKHPLDCAWTLWYQSTKTGTNWKDSFKAVYTFSHVETFWAVLDKIRGPSELTHGSSFYLFKQGIKPDWEDKHNRSGGRWITMNDLKCRDGLNAIWLEVMLLLIGEGFGDDGDEICGAGLDIRAKGDKIAVWTANSKNEKAIMKIGNEMKKRVEPLPNFAPQRQRMMYELHEDPDAGGGGCGYRPIRGGSGEKQDRCLHTITFDLKMQMQGMFPFRV